MIYKTIGTFRVFSDSASLADIERILNLKSAGGYSKGDPVSKSNPNSKTRSDSLWTFGVERKGEAGQDASALMDKMLAELLVKVETLLPSIVGYNCDIQAAMFSDNEQVNCYLSKSILSRLSNLDVDLLISGYADTSE